MLCTVIKLLSTMLHRDFNFIVYSNVLRQWFAMLGTTDEGLITNTWIALILKVAYMVTNGEW